MFATKIAYKMNLEFVFNDRSFSQLSHVAYYGFGTVFQILLRVLTDWDIDIV